MSIESPKLERPPEEVKESALRFKGEVFTGFLHVHALDKLELKYPNWKQLQNGGEVIEDGFITTVGRFVNRDEAQKIAQPKLEEELKQSMEMVERTLKR
jgi:hypothetical protein